MVLERSVDCTKMRNAIGALICNDCKYCTVSGDSLVCVAGEKKTPVSKFDSKCDSFKCYVALPV